MLRQHPFKIVTLMSKNFWLLLIPVVRGLISMNGSIYEWLKGAWLDIVVLLLIIVSAYLRWYFSSYRFTNNSVDYRSGIFVKTKMSIPLKHLTAVSAERNFWLRPFGAVTLYFDTNSGFLNTPDLKIMVSRKDYDRIFEELLSNQQIDIKTSYRPSRINLIFFSLVFSSTLSGVIIVGTFIYQSGQIIGRSLENILLTTATDISDKLVLGIPPLGIAIAIVIGAGWLISFITNILRYIGFRIRREGKKIFIKTGFFTKRRYFINSDKVNYADIRQNLMMKLFRVMSVHVDCAGYGKAKNELPVFVPITTKKQVLSSLRIILPHFNVTKAQVKPSKMVVFRYFMIPFYIMIGLPVVAMLLIYFLPLWKSMILFALVTSEIPIFYLLIVKLVSFFTTGIACDEDSISLHYCNVYQFHTVIIPKDKIATVTLSQNGFQTFANSCNLTIHSQNEFTKSHFIISMPLEKTKEFLKTAGLNSEELYYFKPKKSRKKRLQSTI